MRHSTPRSVRAVVRCAATALPARLIGGRRAPGGRIRDRNCVRGTIARAVRQRRRRGRRQGQGRRGRGRRGRMRMRHGRHRWIRAAARAVGRTEVDERVAERRHCATMPQDTDARRVRVARRLGRVVEARPVELVALPLAPAVDAIVNAVVAPQLVDGRAAVGVAVVAAGAVLPCPDLPIWRRDRAGRRVSTARGEAGVCPARRHQMILARARIAG